VKVLLVEDNPGDARLIRVYLSEAGAATFELTHVERLAEGITRVRENGYDVVLLDLSLPDASGLDTVTRMHAAAAACPIVVLTVTDDEAIALRTLRVGAQDYLTKGRIDSVLLTRAIRYAIERRRSEQALRESEERFRVLYASIIDAVLVHRVATKGRPGRIVEANDAASRLLGYTRGELLTKSITDVSLSLPGPDPRSIVTRLPSGRDALFELVFTARDGRHVFAEVHASLLTYGGEDAVLYVLRDVTERNRAEAEIARKNAELSGLNEVKNQLLGMAAHDLRNPLSVIQTASSFLLEDAARRLPAEERTAFMHRIKDNSEFMLRLIDDLLDVARIESGRLDLDLVRQDLCAVIGENVSFNRTLAEQKNIRLDFAAECGLPPLRFDRSKIEQVLSNLISNAVKFSAPGTSVVIRAAFESGSAVVSVQDQGPGISAQELDKLFKPFSKISVRSTAGEKSTGLGLAISRKIVEGHGGRIWAESEIGKGTTFRFSLPVS
jgi:PAS domain S-box-containing protein